jgi:hypothetical protein
MILAIRDQHWDRPLTRDVTSRYGFDSGAFDLNSIATQLTAEIG